MNVCFFQGTGCSSYMPVLMMMPLTPVNSFFDNSAVITDLAQMAQQQKQTYVQASSGSFTTGHSDPA
ncbi:MAG: hypothetical protein K6E77_12625 [Lachnospiraceae bacterium]|nr:hypothetical protein [Lachnospiraceae bacterium]